VLVDGFSWRPGAEILITSATRNPDNVYERTIVGTQWLGAVHGFPGTVWFGPISGYRLTLNEPIGPTTTLKDHSVMAVEVALLSRNIVWEGGEGSDDLMGGHFWILRTPGVPQHLEGVDIQNFGQQGVLARYPIHVHFGYESNSVEILRNTIRDSNQRCLSIHGTNSTLVQDNVAYNIKGKSLAALFWISGRNRRVPPRSQQSILVPKPIVPVLRFRFSFDDHLTDTVQGIVF